MTFRTFSSLLSISMLVLPLAAQEEAVPAAPKKAGAAHAATAQSVPIVQLEVVMISVPKADSLALAERFKNPATAEEAYRSLADKVQAKQAKLIGYPIFETRSGNRGVIENINEVRYAIQYQPADREPATAAPANPATGPNAQPAGVALLPTTFETRNTGVTLEAEPVVSADGKTIDVQFAVQHVEFLGWDAADLDDKASGVPRVPQPRFHTNKLSTNMSLQPGQRALAGVFESATDPETMEFFIITAGKRMVGAK